MRSGIPVRFTGGLIVHPKPFRPVSRLVTFSKSAGCIFEPLVAFSRPAGYVFGPLVAFSRPSGCVFAACRLLFRMPALSQVPAGRRIGSFHRKAEPEGQAVRRRVPGSGVRVSMRSSPLSAAPAVCLCIATDTVIPLLIASGRLSFTLRTISRHQMSFIAFISFGPSLA